MIDISILKHKLTEMYGFEPMMHMPYIFYYNKKKIFLFTVKINDFWKLHIYINNKILRVDLGNDENINECNPYIVYEENKYKFYYTYNDFYNNKMILKEYELTDMLFKPTSFKFIQNIDGINSNVYFKDINDIINIPYLAISYIYNRDIYKINNIYHIMCIRPIYNQRKILFTLVNKDARFSNCVLTLIFDIQSKVFKLIRLNNNTSIYKCTIDPETNDLYYAERTGNKFEDRTIYSVSKKEYKLEDTRIIFL